MNCPSCNAELIDLGQNHVGKTIWFCKTCKVFPFKNNKPEPIEVVSKWKPRKKKIARAKDAGFL